MFGLNVNLKETRIYRDLEAEAEARFLKAAQRLADRGMTNEEIAEVLDLSLEQVQEVVQQAKFSDQQVQEEHD